MIGFPVLRLSPLVMPLVLAACATDTPDYPSLAPRAVEKKGFAEPEVKAAEAKSDPALDRRIVGFVERLDRIATGFATDTARAESAARGADGKPAGSDAWLDAQTALATLDDWRAQTSTLNSDVEGAAIARAATLATAYPALTALTDRIAASAKEQSATIARIQARLAPA